MKGEYQRASASNSAQPVSSEGEVVEVTWGEENFSPVQYNGFRVGPFKVATRVRPGETIAQAMQRVHREIDQHVRAVTVPEKTQHFLQSLREIGAAVGQPR